MARAQAYDIRPASEDPLGDPADQEGFGQDIRPASEDPLGDPADQFGGQNVLPASMDPLGDPADQMDQASNHPDFGGAVHDHISQMNPADFQQQAQQAAYQMEPHQQQAVAGDLLGALQQKGIDLRHIGSMFGLGVSPSPEQMGPQGLGQLLGWAQQNHPEAVSQAVTDKPWFLKQLGNPVVSGILQSLVGRLSGR